MPPASCTSADGTRQVTMVVFSGDLDRLMAAFSIATGAAASGMRVSMFFTFWGLSALRRRRVGRGKGLLQRMLGRMLPSGPARVPTSRMNMFGLGPRMFGRLMRQHGVAQLPELVDLACEMGVHMIACRMSMDLMGLREDELIENLDYAGVATFLADAVDSDTTLFL